MLQVVRLRGKNRLITSVIVSFSFFVWERPVRAQDSTGTMISPGADGVTSDAIASFPGAATGEQATAPPPSIGINAVSAAGNPET